MSIPPIRTDAEFLADNAPVAELLRKRFPDASEEELARALRTAKWLQEPSEQLSEADLASYLLRERSGLSAPPSSADKPLW